MNFFRTWVTGDVEERQAMQREHGVPVAGGQKPAEPDGEEA